LENVFDRLELAELYQINSLKFSCGQLIRQNLSKLKMDAKWLELKTEAPKLAFTILEGFSDEKQDREVSYVCESPQYHP
jgi:hypothetical protein